MLKIIVNNTEIDLGKLKGLTLQYNGGIFEFEEIIGSYTIPFNIPISDLNRLVFDFPYRHENVDDLIREFNAEIWHSGIQILSGTIRANIFKSDSISCTLFVDNGNLYKKLKEKKLNEHYLGGNKTFTFKSEYDYTSDDFLLYQVNNLSFFTDTVMEGEATLPKYEENQNLYESSAFVFNQYEPCAITPFPLLYKVLEYLFRGLGFEFINTYFTGDYRRLNIFNVNNAVQAEDYYHVDSWYVRNIMSTYNLANHVPSIETDKFLIALQNFFNIVFIIDNSGKVTTIDRKAMLSDSAYDDFSDKLLNIISRENSDKTTGYNLSTEKDGQDSAQKWITNYGEYDTVTYTESSPPDGNIGDVHHFYWLWFLKKSVSYYIDGLMRYTSGWSTLPLNSPYTFIFRNFNYFQSFSHGNKGFKINLGLSTCSDYDANQGQYEDSTYNGQDGIQYIPHVDMKGNTYVRESTIEFAFRLMSYLAIGETKIDGTSNTIPLGTQEKGVTISPYWAYQNRWKEFIAWYSKTIASEFEAEIKLSANEIKNFDFSKKKLIDRNLFFIKSFKVQLLRNTIAPAKVVMIKV